MQDVRTLLEKSGIKPEQLPAEEDIQKLKRRLESNNKKLLTDSRKLKNKNKKNE
jgi:DNA-damage-inducible protein D